MTALFPTLMALAFTLPGLLSFAVNAYIAAVQPSDAQMAVLVRINGLLDGFVYVLAFVVLAAAVAVGRPLVFANRFARYYICISLAALAYFAGILILTPAAGNSIGYTVGDLYRAVLPWISIVVLFSVFPGSEAFRDRFIRLTIAIAFAAALVGGVVKAVFAAKGVFYGAGLLQYYVGSFVLSYVLLRVTHGSYAPARAVGWSVVLAILVALSVLSFKRGTWILIAFTLTMTLVLSTRRARALGFVAVLIGLFGFAGHVTGLNAMVAQRLTYTISGPRVADASSFERVAEGAGAMHALATTRVPLAFLTGLGHGAEFRAAPGFPMKSEEGGSAPGLFHHIHSTPFLLMFRYGAVGLALYGLLILPVFVLLARVRSRRYREFLCRNWHGQVCLATLVAVLGTLILGLKGNVIYGATFGSDLFILVGSYLAAAKEYEESIGLSN
ncbi:MAG TPA: hypothetical protein VF188_10710 [Longimicrobiales bacterium]